MTSVTWILESDVVPHALANEIATSLEAPTPVYVLDICQVGDEYRLMELNPFGGADLYDCDADAIVEAVSDYAIKEHQS